MQNFAVPSFKLLENFHVMREQLHFIELPKADNLDHLQLLSQDVHCLWEPIMEWFLIKNSQSSHNTVQQECLRIFEIMQKKLDEGLVRTYLIHSIWLWSFLTVWIRKHKITFQFGIIHVCCRSFSLNQIRDWKASHDMHVAFTQLDPIYLPTIRINFCHSGTIGHSSFECTFSLIWNKRWSTEKPRNIECHFEFFHSTWTW